MRSLILSLGFAAAVSSAAPALACEDAPLRAGWNGTGDLYAGLLLAAETGYAAEAPAPEPRAAEPRSQAPAWKFATVERPSTARAAAESAWGAASHGAQGTMPAAAHPAGWTGHVIPRKPDHAHRGQRSADPHAAEQHGLTLGSAP